MKSKEIQKHIDRVVGTEGIFRIPSWWMHKILSDLVKYCEDNEGASSIKSYIESQLNLIGEEIDGLDERLKNVENHELFEIVSKLPSEPKDNTIYLIPSQNGEDNNVLTEWVYINDSWEKLGEFKVQLDQELYAYPVYTDGKENKVVELGSDAMYFYVGELVASEDGPTEGELTNEAFYTSYCYQPIYDGKYRDCFEELIPEYITLYIGNDIDGYSSNKVYISEDADNLTYYDFNFIGGFGPRSLKVAISPDYILHYKNYFHFANKNSKVFFANYKQQLDINLIPQEIPRKEDITTESKKAVIDYNISTCHANFANWIHSSNKGLEIGLHIYLGELGSKTLIIDDYMTGIDVSFQLEREDENSFYYTSDVADISINKETKTLKPGIDDTIVHWYSLQPKKLIASLRYDEVNQTFDFSNPVYTLGNNVTYSNVCKGIRLYFEMGTYKYVNIIDSAYYFRSDISTTTSFYCVYLRNKYIEFKIILSEEIENNVLYNTISLEIIKEIDIPSLESRLEALEQKLNEITTND